MNTRHLLITTRSSAHIFILIDFASMDDGLHFTNVVGGGLDLLSQEQPIHIFLEVLHQWMMDSNSNLL